MESSILKEKQLEDILFELIKKSFLIFYKKNVIIYMQDKKGSKNNETKTHGLA